MDDGISRLEAIGGRVETIRRQAGFRRFAATLADGTRVDVDAGVDYRVLEPIIVPGIGEVLTLDDAVGNKVAAVFSRGEARDFLDVDAIRKSGRFSDARLVELAAERDGGVTTAMLAVQLDRIRRIDARAAHRYSVSPEQWRGVQARCIAWAVDLAAERGDATGRSELGPLTSPPSESGPGLSL